MGHDKELLQPVGLSRDLPAGRAMRADVNGRDLVVWRAMSGALAAWDNRCPHRGMRLSHGFVRGNRLACLYHGWHYETSGKCSYIPAHPDLDPPATIQTVSYAVSETAGVIWVGTDDKAMPPPGQGDLVPLRSLIVDSAVQQINAAVPLTPFAGVAPQFDGPSTVVMADVTLTVLFNPQTGARTQLTLLAHSNPGLPMMRALSRWSEALRRTAETRAAA